ncbi:MULTISPECIES: 4Fe-4S dicluster domain-containing protein [unclassified Bradyrhizobium]|uniref:4Fe-4S dicluster domain-containing protein n=1 Tax=unclassified Bradyrhizobium TaxID=2631580 RepID=UPI001FF76769|nr:MULTISPECIES: 4Fe-4S dicluster domain-containing protein [unclassified Bradyrhizobium]
MNIAGQNTLACTKSMSEDLPQGEPLRVLPLPHQPVGKDLVPDLTNFYAQLALVEPWLQTRSPEPQKEWRQSHEHRAKLDGLYECILCACCSTSCPSYWWDSERFLRPAALIQPRAGSTTAGTKRRASGSTCSKTPSGFYRCHPILNCAKACPKGLNPGEAIAALRLKMVERKF